MRCCSGELRKEARLHGRLPCNLLVLHACHSGLRLLPSNSAMFCKGKAGRLPSCRRSAQHLGIWPTQPQSPRTCSRTVLPDALNRAGVRLSWSTVVSGAPLSRSAACTTEPVAACSGTQSARRRVLGSWTLSPTSMLAQQVHIMQCRGFNDLAVTQRRAQRAGIDRLQPDLEEVWGLSRAQGAPSAPQAQHGPG